VRIALLPISRSATRLPRVVAARAPVFDVARFGAASMICLVASASASRAMRARCALLDARDRAASESNARCARARRDAATNARARRLARARGASARAVADASRGQMRGVAPPRGVARARSAARRRWRARKGRGRAEARGRGGRAARSAATTRGTRRRFGPRLKLENFAFGDRSTRARRDARGSGRRRRRAMG